MKDKTTIKCKDEGRDKDGDVITGQMHQPWRDIASLLHESSKWEPETVKDAEVVGRVGWRLWILHFFIFIQVPFVRTKTTHQEENHADADVGKHNAHPDLIRQRVQEGKDPGLGLLWFLDHDGNAQTHEGLGEIYHLLSYQGYSEGSHSYIRSLEIWNRVNLSWTDGKPKRCWKCDEWPGFETNYFFIDLWRVKDLMK